MRPDVAMTGMEIALLSQKNDDDDEMMWHSYDYF